MDEIEVPALFLCPISLQLMRDPVTVCTGITYDRENIERWLFSCRKNTCPVTKQSLLSADLISNLTLHRLIQNFCTLNPFLGIELPIPTPEASIEKSRIVKLLSEAKRFPDKQLECLRSIRSISSESERNKYYLESAGAIEFLASIMKINSQQDSNNVMTEAAIEVLFYLNPSVSQLKNLMNEEGIQFIESLFQVLKHGSHQSRGFAIMLMKLAFEVAEPTQLNSIRREFFVEITRVLKDQISVQASKAALKLLVGILPRGRNRIKAVEGDTVLVLIELLLDASSERRLCELFLMALDKLCGCAEGRAELLNHGAGLAIVSKKILRVSHVASDRGVRILNSVCRHSATPRVLYEMLQVGAVSKLCLVIQVDGNFEAKERAKEILKLHSAVWKSFPCIPVPLPSIIHDLVWGS